MANDISDAFIKAYADDVKLAYQRGGSLLLGCVRRKTEVEGSTADFFKMGSGAATTKSRNGLIIPMNPTHDTATATLADRYAPEYVDKLDEKKMSYDERQALVKTGSMALGRASDSDITAVLDAATTYSSGPGAAAFAITDVEIMLFGSSYGIFGRNVPADDGGLFVAIGPVQWGDLMQVAAFSSADYVKYENSFIRNTMAKQWMGATFILHTGLPKSGNNRSTFAFHKDSIGHASGQEIQTEINYIAERAAWLVNSMMSMGACLIDAEGVTRLLVDETK